MPDYTYHPILKPLLFRLPVEFSRRLTLRLLEIQARTALGRRVFQFFGHGIPPKEISVTVFGLHFPGPIGLGPGIDIEGTTIPVMQHLGFGFITIGPLGANETPRHPNTDPLRNTESYTLIQSDNAGAPAASTVCAAIKNAPDLRIPIGIALRGDQLENAISQSESAAAFFTVPLRDLSTLKKLRAATSRPLLLRISPDWTESELYSAVDEALEVGLNGCVATSGAPTDLLPDGKMDGPFLFAQALEAVKRVSVRYGDSFPIIAGGGIMTPEQGVAMLDAGAKLVELGSGLVFAGPGLPGRLNHAIEHRIHHRGESAVCNTIRKNDSVEVQSEHARPLNIGALLLALTGFILAAAGLFALYLAATIKLLPSDVAYLGMSMTDLCNQNQCRIVHFMAHDRVSFGGSIISIGLVYMWLAWVPLRRGESWSWWALLISGTLGFGSFLTYIGYGYLDIAHGVATLSLLPLFIAGMALSFRSLKSPKGFKTLLKPGAVAWLWSRAGWGRALMLFTASGMILGGFTIMLVGMSAVFVPQDLEYMQITAKQIDALNPRLIPLIAHDRAGFGGGLCSGGAAIFLSAWCGLRPGARSLWWIFLFAGSIGFVTAIGIHPIVGYTSFIHLLPAYAGAVTFLLGMKNLYKPVCGMDASAASFPDL